MIWRLEERFRALGRGRAVLLGAAIGAVFGGGAWLSGAIWPVVVGFLLYFPLHIWLTISLVLVVFSAHERGRLVGPGLSFATGFFGRIFSAYGLFCLGWFYLVVAGAAAQTLT